MSNSHVLFPCNYLTLLLVHYSIDHTTQICKPSLFVDDRILFSVKGVQFYSTHLSWNLGLAVCCISRYLKGLFLHICLQEDQSFVELVLL